MPVIGLSWLLSCSKASSGYSSKVKTYIEEINSPAQSSDTFNVSYDANDRVVSILSSFSGSGFLFYYNGNTSYTMDIMNNSHLVIREISFINSDLLVDSSFQYNDTNDSSTQRFIYDQHKQLMLQKTYAYSVVAGARLIQKNEYTYDNNGNVLKDIETDAAGNNLLIITYTYSNIVAGIFSLSTIYHPSPFKNLPVTKSYFTPSGNTTQTVTFAYTFDSNNRIAIETQTVNPGTVGVQKFSYY